MNSKPKFITSISMEVTREQYEKDLKEPLKELGYNSEVYTNFDDFTMFTYLSNIFSGKVIGLIDKDMIKKEQYIIDHYNPELYLALAAMTEGEDWIIGEYLVYNNNIFKVESFGNGCNNNFTKGIANNNCPSYKKATKEELIKHFSKMNNKEEFKLPENWCIKITVNNYKILANYFNTVVSLNSNHLNHSPIGEFLHIDDYEFNFIGSVHHNDFIEITFEQFKKYVLKEEEDYIEDKDSRFPFKLHPKNAQKIIDIACHEWKNKLAEKWATRIVKGTHIKIEQGEYILMRQACTKDQHKLFDEIFGKDTLECVFKQGEYIVYDNKTYHIECTDDGTGRVQLRDISFENGRTIRFVDIANINKNAHLWSIDEAVGGEPVWVKGNDGCFHLRYSNGESITYCNQWNKGPGTTTFKVIIPFDPFNLPCNE